MTVCVAFVVVIIPLSSATSRTTSRIRFIASRDVLPLPFLARSTSRSISSATSHWVALIAVPTRVGQKKDMTTFSSTSSFLAARLLGVTAGAPR